NVSEIMTNGNNAAIQHGGDNGAVNIANFVEWHNTDIGDRTNEMYTSSGITPSVTKTGAGGNSLRWRTNAKSDYDWVQNLGHANGNDRTGNFKWRYGVDRTGFAT